MRFPLPHDPDGRPCLPTRHPRSQPPSPDLLLPTRSNSRTPRPRTCWPTSPLSPDPRAARSRRHRLVAILALAAAAVLAGARSIAAIAEWAADTPQPVRAALGARPHAPGCFAVPAEATIRRTLARPDADALAAAVGAWLADRERVRSGPATTGGGRSPSTARPCAPPAPAPPTATAARRTCWPAWTTPPARCWPNARSAAHPRRSPPSPAAGPTRPGRRGRHHRRAADPPAGRRVPGDRETGALPVGGQGQPAHPAGPLPAPTLAPRPRAGPHPRPRPRPHRDPDPQGDLGQPVRVPPRRPGPAGHPQDPQP
jgi:DDE_Tnp_1-associated